MQIACIFSISSLSLTHSLLLYHIAKTNSNLQLRRPCSLCANQTKLQFSSQGKKHYCLKVNRKTSRWGVKVLKGSCTMTSTRRRKRQRQKSRCGGHGKSLSRTHQSSSPCSTLSYSTNSTSSPQPRFIPCSKFHDFMVRRFPGYRAIQGELLS